MSVNFCHISPIETLELVSGNKTHLALAHLIKDKNQKYIDFYKEESDNGSIVILDNSGFEMYKRGLSMMSSDDVIECAKLIKADYIILSDYPGEESTKTINKAKETKDYIQSQGFKTFFVPQSEVGDLEGYIKSICWGLNNCDLVGISILGAPNAFGNIEKDNKLQRFLSRWKVMSLLSERNILTKEVRNKFHFLGMLDGPNEIELVKKYHKYIYSWDSSIAIQRGIHQLGFDNSPSGCISGKFEKEVDFNCKSETLNIPLIKSNINFIDNLCK